MPESLSIVIPCYPPHARFLLRALQSIAGQTLKPLETLIGLSETSEAEAQRLSAYLSRITPCKVIPSEQKCLPAANRNRAMQQAAGDLVVFMDADDTMHPQKLEIVEYFAVKTQCKLLLHGYLQSSFDYPWYSPAELKWVGSEEILRATFGSPAQRNLNSETGPQSETNCYAGGDYEVMHSCAAVTRDVLKRIQYVNLPSDTRLCEDGRFCRDVLWEYRSACYVCAKLLAYIK